MSERVNILKEHMNTENASIGRVVIRYFSGEDNLRYQLEDYIECDQRT